MQAANASLRAELEATRQERAEAQEGAQFYLKRAADAKILQQAAEAQVTVLTVSAPLEPNG